MDFKSRFQGKTSVLTKQGLTTLFSAPGNPIVKCVPPPYQEMSPHQHHYSDAQFYKNQMPTHQKPTSSVAAFRPKVIVKKANPRPSNFFEFNNYIGPVQYPNEEQFGKMSKSLLATLNKKAKEREAVCEITTPGTSSKKSQTAREFQKSDKNLLMRSNSGEVRFLSPNEKQDVIRNLVVPEREVIHTPIKQQMPQNLGNTYNDPQYTQRLVVLSRQKSRETTRKNSTPDYNPGSSGYNIPLRASFSGLPQNQNEFRNTSQKDAKLRIILSRDRDVYGIGSRERYFKNFRKTRPDLTDRAPEINLLSKSLNVEERIAQRGDYQDYVYEGNVRNRSYSYVQETNPARMSQMASSNRAATTERFRLPNIEKEAISKMGMSRVFDNNSSFKNLPSRRQY